MKTKTKKIDISYIAPFFLFTFFAICVMSVLIIGAKLYRIQSQRDIVGYNNRTASQYISTRIRQSDKYESFFVSDFDVRSPQATGNAFFFTEIIDGIEYYTCIYYHDGYLCELFACSEDYLDTSAGEKILQIKSLAFFADDNNVTVDITHIDGSEQTIVINLRSFGEKIS